MKRTCVKDFEWCPGPDASLKDTPRCEACQHAPTVALTSNQKLQSIIKGLREAGESDTSSRGRVYWLAADEIEQMYAALEKIIHYAPGAWQADIARGAIGNNPTAHETLCDGWQPIGSAPTDRPFLVSIHGMPDIAWPAYKSEGKVYSNAHGVLNEVQWDGRTLRADYWRPMPKSPGASEKASEPLGRCCYGGFKPKSACASCAAWPVRGEMSEREQPK